ncbi:hypothetical protein [Pseudoalteromonas sp. GB56]
MLHDLDCTFDAVGNLTERAQNFGDGGSNADFCELSPMPTYTV